MERNLLIHRREDHAGVAVSDIKVWLDKIASGMEAAGKPVARYGCTNTST